MKQGFFDLSGKRALVTGSSMGIGRALAEGLAEYGASVVMNARNADRLEASAEELRVKGYNASTAVFDVTDGGAFRDGIARIEDSEGPIDILINNAGMQFRSPLEDFPEDKWDLLLKTNITSAFLVGKAVAKFMIPRKTGKIINIASTEGLGASRGISPYTAAKHGVVGLTRSLAVELGARGITVNCVCPGPIHTGMTSVIPDEHKEKFARRRVPLRRYGTPEEVAHVIASIALPASSYLNGAVIPVDGGLTAKGD